MSNTTLSHSVESKQNYLRDSWRAICVTLQDFKYWLVEGSLHEPLKPHTQSNEKVDAKSPAHQDHRTFKEVSISRLQCDRCRKLAMKYQCTDCDQGYCTDCWPRTQKRGAHLEGTGETGKQPFDPKHQLVQMRNLGPHYSATSSRDISPMQMPTENPGLQHIDDYRFPLLPNISPSLS